MSFALNAEQLEIRDAVARLCGRFGDDYWLQKDSDGAFPHEFHRAMAEAGWLECVPWSESLLAEIPCSAAPPTSNSSTDNIPMAPRNRVLICILSWKDIVERKT